jgi:transcriptional regulator with XRE-family HTH domain
MSIVPYEVQHANGYSTESTPATQPTSPLHRLRKVRKQQHLSLRTVARRLNLTVVEAERQEAPDQDLTMSQIYDWQRVLGVPVAELLEDSEMHLSAPVEARARLVRLMKTAVTIMEATPRTKIRPLVQMLIDQLVEIMPELQTVGAWQSSGSQRGLDDLGRAAERIFDESNFY